MTATTTSVRTVLEGARAAGRTGLIGYLPAGFPDRARSGECLRALVESGCDVVEVGLPYSDPVMDGPTIQAAAGKALADGTRIADVLRVVGEVADAGGAAVVMTYWAPVARYGVERFARDLADVGGSGLITPDLIPEEADEWLAASDAHDLDRIFLVAPSSSPERLALTTAACRGFVYVASTMGVTGARDTISSAAPALVARTREFTDLPLGVGLGVRTPEHVTSVGAYADAVIVGSALVSAIDADPDHPARAVGALVAELHSATGRAG